MGKRPLHITAQANGRRADIRIEGVINSFEGASAKAFGESIAQIAAKGIRDAHVYIDSEGGNVLEAKRIVAAMRKLTGSITVEGGAMVASAATYIAVKADAFHLRPDTAVMVHKPMVGVAGNEDELQSSLKAIKDITQEYRAAYATKTGKTDDEVEAMWSKGDRWFTGTEAVAEGLADGLVEDAAAEDNEELMDEEAVSRIAACGCPADKLPKARTAPKHDEMDIKAMRALLGMSEVATEAEVLARVEALKKENTRHAEAAKALREGEVKAVLDKAIADRKLTEAHRASYEAKFNAAFDATKAEVEALSAAPNVADEVRAGAEAGAVTASAKGRENWDYAMWAAKDPKGLQELMAKDKNVFTALYQAHYGHAPSLTA
jgi:ATP-dependent protease ClpP protease subunit